MGLFFAPVANVVLGTVRRAEEGQASGANNAIRELGGVFGVAVLASIFAARGGYGSATSFTDGLTAAVWVGAVVVGIGALAALTIPVGRRIPQAVPSPERSAASVPGEGAGADPCRCAGRGPPDPWRRDEPPPTRSGARVRGGGPVRGQSHGGPAR